MTLGHAHAAALNLEVRRAASRRERSMLWREVKSANLFAGPRAFHDFFTVGGGGAFYLEQDPSYWLILGRWKEASGIGIIWAIRAGRDESRALVQAASLDGAPELGFKCVITRPLTVPQADLFLSLGFTPLREIAIFEMHIDRAGETTPELPLPNGVILRSFRGSDTDGVLGLDARCFDDFWSLDYYTLAGVARAASVNVFLVATMRRRIIGYAIAGVSNRNGYLQRLGVDPDFQGSGTGKALSAKVIDWMSRNGAAFISVNTQKDNERASRLYEGLGFRKMGLSKFLFAREVAT